MKQAVWDLCSNGDRLLAEGKILVSQKKDDVARIKFETARKAFQRAVDLLDPDDKREHDEGEHNEEAKAYAYAHLGEAQRWLQDDNAEDNFLTAIACSKKIGKRNPYALAHLGEYYRNSAMMNRAHLQEARDYFTKAIGKESEAPYLWAYAHRGASHDFSGADIHELKAARDDLTYAIENSASPYAWALAYRSIVHLLLVFEETDIKKVQEHARHAWKDLLNAMADDPTIIGPDSEAASMF